MKGETKARITSLQRINDSDLPEEQKQQLRFWHYVKADEQRNFVSVVENTIPQLTEDARPEDVEPDWYRHFFNRQCSVSDSDMQQIWARILAGEANQPGSFSKRTLSIVSDIDKDEAEVFSTLCGFCWEIDGNLVPLIVRHVNNVPIYSQHSITFPVLSHFQSIGLLQYNHLSAFAFPPNYSVSYFGRKLELDTKEGFYFGHGYFTVCGKELSSICDREPVEGLWEHAIENYKEIFGQNVVSVSFV